MVFDFDGTLIDSNDLKRQVFLSLSEYEPCGLEIMKGILEINDIDRYEIWKRFAFKLNKDFEFAKNKVDHFNIELRKAMSSAPEISGATNLLEFAKSKQILVFISSMTPVDELKLEIKSRNWTDYVYKAFGSPDKKPLTLAKIMRKYSLKASDLIVIGDGADDKESAAINGIKFINVGEGRGAAQTEKIYELKNIIELLYSEGEIKG